MFNEKLKDLMKARKMTASLLCETLNKRGVDVSLWTVRAWMQGARQPKSYVQAAILLLLSEPLAAPAAR